MYSELAGCSATPQLAPPQPEVLASASPALVSTGSSREPSQPPGFSTPAGGVENHNHLQLLHRHCLIRLQLPWCHLLNWRWHPHRHLLLHLAATNSCCSSVWGFDATIWSCLLSSLRRQSSHPRVFTYARFATTASPTVGLLNC